MRTDWLEATEPTPTVAVGELRVEVLEASGLPNLDTLSQTDAYVLVLIEGIAARTCTIDDDLDPKWHAESPRAFRLPITCASSSLFVGVFDDDSGSSLGALDDDDPIGRVVIQPCNLRPHTAIDAWWPLAHQAVGERPGERGCACSGGTRSALPNVAVCPPGTPVKQVPHPPLRMHLLTRVAPSLLATAAPFACASR